MYPTEDETALWIALNRAQRSIYRSMDSALRAKGLPPLRWYDVLWAVERARDDGVRPYELERWLIFEQSNLSRLLSRMIASELVKETTFQNDRRGKLLRITPKGCAIRLKMWQIYGPLIRQHMSNLPAAFDLAETAAAVRSLFEQDNDK